MGHEPARDLVFSQARPGLYRAVPPDQVPYIGFIMAAFTEKKQALHDVIAGCLVVRKPS